MPCPDPKPPKPKPLNFDEPKKKFPVCNPIYSSLSNHFSSFVGSILSLPSMQAKVVAAILVSLSFSA
jgi:hypothetical protein